MEGYIKLHRQLLNWEWYDDANTMRLFIHLLISANHQAGRYKGIPIARGQFLTGRISLAEDLKLSEQAIRSAINRLKSTNEITTKSTTKYTIITITNYELYQWTKPDKTTNGQPSSNQPTTTNKNDNNNNNEKNTDTVKKIEVYEKVFLTEKQTETLQTLYGKLYQAAIEKLSIYKASKGKEYKSDYHTMIKGGWVYKEILAANPGLGARVTAVAQEIEDPVKVAQEKAEKRRILKIAQELNEFYEKLPKEEQKHLTELAKIRLGGAVDIMKTHPDRLQAAIQAKRREITQEYKKSGILPTT